MPHAEETTMSAPLVNGERPPSQFISHLKSYPVVSDISKAYKQNPYGAKSLTLAHNASEALIHHVRPYAEKPYADYVSPYVSRADELGSRGLDTVDAHFPIVKEPTQNIRALFASYARAPLGAAHATRDYVFQTWGSEYKKCGGDGYVAATKAVVTTGLVVTSQFLASLGDYLAQAKGKAKTAAKKAQ